jgi:hypothetical protein
MPENTLSQQAREEILKKIIEWSPEIQGTGALLNLAEAYALVTGQVTSRGAVVTASK